VLLGGEAGHRLENVGEVRRAIFDGPILHRRSDIVGHGRIERQTELDRLLKCLESEFGQALALDLFVENVLPEERFHRVGLEIEAIELMLGCGDRLNGLLANGTHDAACS
jgi:hypothetical protein